MSTSRECSRRRTYVDSHVQAALCKRIFWHWCAFFAVVMLVISGFQVLLGTPGQTWSQRLGSQLGYTFFLGVVVLSLLPAFMLDAVRFSNRFVGPIARLRRGMRELADGGNTEEMRFREGDFWADAAEEFNELRKQHRYYRQLCEAHRLISDETASPEARHVTAN